MNVCFDIDDLEIEIRGVKEKIYVSGEVEYSVSSEGQKATWMDPPMPMEFSIDAVSFDTILRDSKLVVTLKEIHLACESAVKGWFEGDEGVEILKCDYGSWCEAEEEARADAMRLSV